ncbi:MAG TPA: copper resistance CopC family protein, partial [Gemmatimonadaceae bacterium]|nr:copper resistance CopC family protein [Gemmatimonadaceae bacterium]
MAWLTSLAAMPLTPVAASSRSEPVHVALRSSTPAANDTLPTPPERIRLHFTQAVEVRLARIELFDADSASIALPPVRAVDSTDRAIVTDVPSTLGAGTYRVHWTVTSRDSHTIRGDIVFTVLAPA